MSFKPLKNDFKDLSLVVLSSESYSFLWKNFTQLWKKYCGELKLNKYIISTNIDKKYYDFKIITGGLTKEDYWSRRIRSALKKVKTRHVLVLTDDTFVDDNINLIEFKKIYNLYKKKKISYLRICPLPNENFYEKKNIYKLNYYSFHRISLQPSLWEKKYLNSMLLHDENPRMFEENGSKRSKINDKLYSANYYLLNFKEIIRIGKVTPEGKKLIKKENLVINKKYLNMSNLDLADHYYRKLKDKIYYLSPKKIRKFYIQSKYKRKINRNYFTDA